jgi:hypothetical protein
LVEHHLCDFAGARERKGDVDMIAHSQSVTIGRCIKQRGSNENG